MTGRRGIPFVVAAPSGTGKTTVCRAVLERDPCVTLSVSHTTRSPRSGERDGVHYYFVDAAEFRRLNAEGAFLEHAEYGGQMYGTSFAALSEQLEDAGRDVILEIEVQGAAQIRERREDARFVFLLPPNMAELERRLRDRQTDDADAIERRLAMADRELEAIRIFDYAVVNDDLEDAISAVLHIIAAERDGSAEALAEVRDLFAREKVEADWRAHNAHPA
jgi:guanylate kinase